MLLSILARSRWFPQVTRRDEFARSFSCRFVKLSHSFFPAFGGLIRSCEAFTTSRSFEGTLGLIFDHLGTRSGVLGVAPFLAAMLILLIADVVETCVVVRAASRLLLIPGSDPTHISKGSRWDLLYSGRMLALTNVCHCQHCLSASSTSTTTKVICLLASSCSFT